METFRLPSNDERFTALTPQEALRQVLLVEAIKADRADRLRAKQEAALGLERAPEVTTHAPEDAERIAGTAHLTGDPEFDAVELQETDPLRDLPRITVKRA